MKITRFRATPDGGSCFDDLDIAFPDSKTDDFGHVLALSRAFDANGMLVKLPADLDQDWHNAPNRQFVIVLDGVVEVETTDGAVRQARRGEMFMADDTVGQGHRTRAPAGPATLMFIRVPDDFDLSAWARPD